MCSYRPRGWGLHHSGQPGFLVMLAVSSWVVGMASLLRQSGIFRTTALPTWPFVPLRCTALMRP